MGWFAHDFHDAPESSGNLTYPKWQSNMAMGNLGNGGFNWKSSIHGGFSIATFDYRRVTVDMSPFLRGKSSNSGPCSLAMLNCGRMVTLMVRRYLKFILTAHMFDGIEMDLNSFPFLWPFPNSYLIASHFLVSTKGKKTVLGNFGQSKFPGFYWAKALVARSMSWEVRRQWVWDRMPLAGWKATWLLGKINVLVD